MEFTLYDRPLDAFGLERVTARWRYTIRGGGVADRSGSVRFDGDSATALIALAGEWSRSRGLAPMAMAQSVPAELSALAAKATLDGPVAAWCRGTFRPGHPGAFAVAVTSAAEVAGTSSSNRTAPSRNWVCLRVGQTCLVTAVPRLRSWTSASAVPPRFTDRSLRAGTPRSFAGSSMTRLLRAGSILQTMMSSSRSADGSREDRLTSG